MMECLTVTRVSSASSTRTSNDLEGPGGSSTTHSRFMQQKRASCPQLAVRMNDVVDVGNYNVALDNGKEQSQLIQQKRASCPQPQMRMNDVVKMGSDNVALDNGKEQHPLADRRASSISSTSFSPALESLEQNEEERTANGESNDSNQELDLREVTEEVQPLEKEIKDPGAEVAATWMVMAQERRRPTLKQAWKEMKRQSHLGLPMAVTNMLWFARFMVSTVFLGQMGGLELAAGTLALTFANVAGWSVLVGLAGGMEAVCSQAHGAGRRELLKLTLKRGFIVLLVASLPIAGAWCQAEHLLLLMGQTPVLAKTAQSYLLYLLPDLIATSFVAPLRIFLRSQCITTPILLCSMLSLCVHIPLNYLLVRIWGMGAPGTALAICITDFALAFMLLFYALCFVYTNPPDGIESPSGCAAQEPHSPPPASLSWASLLKLAVPCCLMTCMEGWCYEIMVLLTGLLPQAKEAVETVAIVLNGDTLLYALEVALASCVCTRVGNELGAKRPMKAYRATLAALWVAAAMGCGGAGWLLFFSQMAWGSFFTKDAEVLKRVAQLLPIMALIELANFPQNVACGVLRGSARPAMGALINLGAFYVLGIPLAVLLGFKYKMGLLGLWIGLAAAAATTSILTVTVVLRTDWKMQALRAHELTNQSSAKEGTYTPDEQEEEQVNTESSALIPHKESILLDSFDLKGEYGDAKEDTVQPLANLKELENQVPKVDPMSKLGAQIMEDQFVDGNWKLWKTGSGRQAMGKSYSAKSDGHSQDSSGHCWEVSMSMMNESARKCAMLARLEQQPQQPPPNLLSKKTGGCSQAASHDVKKMVFRKLRLFASKKSQPKKAHLAERRQTN